MSNSSRKNDWTKPAAMAIPKGGFPNAEQGKYGPVFPSRLLKKPLLNGRRYLKVNSEVDLLSDPFHKVRLGPTEF